MDGADVVGELSYAKSAGTLARAESGDAIWTFKRCGLWKPYISIRKEGTHTNLARIILGWHNVLMSEPPLRRVHFRNSSFWHNEWSWVTDEDETIMKFKPAHDHHMRGKILIHEKFRQDGWLMMMALLGWYMLVSLEDEAGDTMVVMS